MELFKKSIFLHISKDKYSEMLPGNFIKKFLKLGQLDLTA